MGQTLLSCLCVPVSAVATHVPLLKVSVVYYFFSHSITAIFHTPHVKLWQTCIVYVPKFIQHR